MTTSGGRESAMAIATLIAAGQLDDRLVDRALGLLRETDPKASFSRWIDEDGALGAVRARPGRYRGPARRAALEEAARRRHGFHDHRPRMYRRARRLCRAQGEGLADHRARDAGRARLP